MEPMSPSLGNPRYATVDLLPAEDIVIHPCCGFVVASAIGTYDVRPLRNLRVIDGQHVRHVTVSSMMASAVRHGSNPNAALVPSDYPPLPVFPSAMTVFEATVEVVETGWELAVVTDNEPRVQVSSHRMDSIVV
jgi:hypothetical protein